MLVARLVELGMDTSPQHATTMRPLERGLKDSSIGVSYRPAKHGCTPTRNLNLLEKCMYKEVCLICPRVEVFFFFLNTH